MAISVVTRPEQGFVHPTGNILDALTGAVALYNMPKNVRLQQQAQQLANAQQQQQTGIQKTEFGWEQGARGMPGGLMKDAGYDPNNPGLGVSPNAGGSTQITPDTNKPSDNGIGTTYPSQFGPGSVGNAVGEAPPPSNDSALGGGNDLSVTGTSANENMSLGKFDPLNTKGMMSALSAGHNTVLSNAPASATEVNTTPAPSGKAPGTALNAPAPTVKGDGGPLGSSFNSTSSSAASAKPAGVRPRPPAGSLVKGADGKLYKL